MSSRTTSGILGLTAALLVYSSFSILKHSPDETIVFSILVGVGTFIIYKLGNKLADVNLQFGPGSVSLHIFLIPVLTMTVISPVGQDVTLFQQISQMPLAAALTFAYYSPLRVQRRFIRGLREIPAVKNVVLALAWSLATTHFTQQAETQSLFLFRFLFIFALSIVTDIRDCHSDSNQGTVTLAVWIGSRKACMAASLLLLIAAVVSHINPFASDNHPLHQLIIPVHTIATAIGVLFLHAKSKQTSYFWLIDFQLFLHALLFMIIQITT